MTYRQPTKSNTTEVANLALLLFRSPQKNRHLYPKLSPEPYNRFKPSNPYEHGTRRIHKVLAVEELLSQAGVGLRVAS